MMGFVRTLVMPVVLGCASTQPSAEIVRTLPEPTFESQVPDEIERPANVSTIPVERCVDLDGHETDGGILFSDETAAYVARLRVAYDELRQLYVIDARTRDRERAIYERALESADHEIRRQARMAERSWWERHGGTIGLVGGIVVGVAATIGVLAATEEVRGGP